MILGGNSLWFIFNADVILFKILYDLKHIHMHPGIVNTPPLQNNLISPCCRSIDDSFSVHFTICGKSMWLFFFQPLVFCALELKSVWMHVCWNRRGCWHASTVPWKFPKRLWWTAGLTRTSARGPAGALQRTEQLSHARLQPGCRRDWEAESQSVATFMLLEKCALLILVGCNA